MLTVTETAKALGFTRQTILNWINNGTIKAVKIGRDYRIDPKEIERLKGGEQENGCK